LLLMGPRDVQVVQGLPKRGTERAGWRRISSEVKAMSTQPQVQTVTTGADKAKLVAAAALLIGSVVAFYLLSQKDMWLRVVACWPA
jgi:hypothetical protein